MGVDLAVIESNHDVGMLRTGPYPLRSSGASSRTAGTSRTPPVPSCCRSCTRTARGAFCYRAPGAGEQHAGHCAADGGVRHADGRHREESGYILDVAPVENLDGRTVEF